MTGRPGPPSGDQPAADDDAGRWREAARLRREHPKWIVIVRHEVAQCEWTRRLEDWQMPDV